MSQQEDDQSKYLVPVETFRQRPALFVLNTGAYGIINLIYLAMHDALIEGHCGQASYLTNFHPQRNGNSH